MNKHQFELSNANGYFSVILFLLVGVFVLPWIAGMTGCSSSKLYDDQWPPRRMNSPATEYSSMGGLRSGEAKKTFLQTDRAAEVESHLNSQ